MSNRILAVTSACLLLLWCLPLTATPLPLNMCYEEQELEPYFMGTGPLPPTAYPGIFIEMLQRLDERIDETNITYQRAPWQRCLNNIKQNSADLVIASYSREREAYGIYPKVEGRINTTNAISKSEYCLFTSRTTDLHWSGENFSKVPQSPLAVPQGYSIVPLLAKHQMPIVKTNSSVAAMELLVKELAIGAVTYCESGANFLWQNAHRKLNIVARSPALTTRHAYLMFSKRFFSENSALVNRLWREMSKVRDSEFRQLLDKYESRKLN